MADIYKIEANEVVSYWPYMREYLNNALEHFDTHVRMPIDYVLCKLIEGEYQSWFIANEAGATGAAVTYIDEYPQGKVLFGFLMGGENISEWGDLLHETMVKYAREQGCNWIEVCSRKGLGKTFYNRLGYKNRYETYTLEVS